MMDSDDGLMDIPAEKPGRAGRFVPGGLSQEHLKWGPFNYPPLLPGGKKFAKSTKHFLIEFKTTGAGPKEALTEVYLLEIDPFSKTMHKVGGEIYHQHYRPGLEMINAVALANGYQNSYLLDKPSFKDVGMHLVSMLRHSCVYTRNGSLLIHVINAHLVSLGLPEIQKLALDVVNIKDHAPLMGLSCAVSIDAFWKSLGTKSNPAETRCRQRIQVFNDGFARLRKIVPVGANVLPIPSELALPITFGNPMLETTSESAPREQKELSFHVLAGSSNTIAVDSCVASESPGATAFGCAEKGSGTEGKDAQDVHIREYTVVIRTLTEDEKEEETATKGMDRVLNIASRTPPKVMKIDNPLIVCRKKFMACEASYKAAKDWRHFASLGYLLADYHRFNSSFVATANQAEAFKHNILTRTSSSDLRKVMPGIMAALIELPLMVAEKVKAMEKLYQLASQPTRGKFELVEGTFLYQAYLSALDTIQSSPEQVAKELNAWFPEGHNPQHVSEAPTQPIEENSQTDANEQAKFSASPLAQPLVVPAQLKAVKLSAATQESPLTPAPPDAKTVVANMVKPPSSQALPKIITTAMPALVVDFKKKSGPVEAASVEISMTVTGSAIDTMAASVTKVFSVDDSILEKSYNAQVLDLPRHADVFQDIRNRKEVACKAVACLNKKIAQLDGLLGRN